MDYAVNRLCSFLSCIVNNCNKLSLQVTKNLFSGKGRDETGEVNRGRLKTDIKKIKS